MERWQEGLVLQVRGQGLHPDDGDPLRLQRRLQQLGEGLVPCEEGVVLREGRQGVRGLRLQRGRRRGLDRQQEGLVLQEQGRGLPGDHRSALRLQRRVRPLGGRLERGEEDVLLRRRRQGVRRLRLRRRRRELELRVVRGEAGMVLRQGRQGLPRHELGGRIRLQRRRRELGEGLGGAQEAVVLRQGRKGVRPLRLHDGSRG
mmetsp:Transcript_58273/g.153451  ORF Transcript_58273/g.153451 Transcript_58273/m.153451 type:complete len:202 (+) Transcript_58273:975-1580(+)